MNIVDIDKAQIDLNLSRIKRRIAEAARRSGRDAGEIMLIAVTKSVSPEGAAAVLDLGIKDLGENRVQEMLAKQQSVGREANWHLIGHLQTNKVKLVVGRVKMIHSLDSMRLAEEINRRSLEAGVVTEVLMQVNVSGEVSKYGLSPVEAVDFLKAALLLPGLKVRGLMTIAPFTQDPEEVRPVFRDLRLLQGRLKEEFPEVPLDYLSMGMTGDYEVAVEEGSNMLRIGTAIFGSRY